MKKRKKRDFDLIPPRKKKHDFDKLDNVSDLPIADDLDTHMKLEGGKHRRIDPSADEIWGPGGLAQEAREYFNKKLNGRSGSSGKKLSKTDKDREIMEKLLDPLGLFGPIRFDDNDADDD